MQKDVIEQKVEAMAEAIIKDTDMQLVDVEYVREGQWYLRVFLDKSGGIEIDDCQSVSEKLAKLLDEEDFIKEKYYLEVSSPGLDRKLRKDRDFLRHKGDSVDVKMYGEKKILIGILGDFSSETVEVITDGQSRQIERKSIASVRLHLDF